MENELIKDNRNLEGGEKNKVPNIISIIVDYAITSMFVIGFFAFVFFWELEIADEILFEVAFKNGINPTIIVFLFSVLMLGLCIYFFKKQKKEQIFLSYHLLSAFLFLSIGISNIYFWIERDCQIVIKRLKPSQQEQYMIISKEKEGFRYIGEVEGRKETNGDSDDDTNTKIITFSLFVKVIEGKKYYYCSRINAWDKIEEFLVEKYDSRRGITTSGYIIDFDFDWNHIYVLSSDAETTDRKSINNQQKESNYEGNDEPQKIVVEHKREPQPVQVWVPCGTCLGGRKCMVCGGNGWLPGTRTLKEDCYSCNGDKLCSACGGRGGQYIVEYR